MAQRDTARYGIIDKYVLFSSSRYEGCLSKLIVGEFSINMAALRRLFLDYQQYGKTDKKTKFRKFYFIIIIIFLVNNFSIIIINKNK